MTSGDNSRLVYSSEGGRVEEPRRRGERAAAAGPRDGLVRVSRTSSGRRGKTVTLVDGVPSLLRRGSSTRPPSLE